MPFLRYGHVTNSQLPKGSGLPLHLRVLALRAYRDAQNRRVRPPTAGGLILSVLIRPQGVLRPLASIAGLRHRNRDTRTYGRVCPSRAKIAWAFDILDRWAVQIGPWQFLQFASQSGCQNLKKSYDSFKNQYARRIMDGAEAAGGLIFVLGGLSGLAGSGNRAGSRHRLALTGQAARYA